MREMLRAALDAASKAQDRRRLATLRLVNAAIEDRDAAARLAGRDKVSEDEVVQILRRMIAQRDDSARLYESRGQVDLAEEEKTEAAILGEFLPRQMDPEAMREACSAVIRSIGAHGLRDTGRCMNALKARHAGHMDFGKASSLVKQLLK